MSLTARAPQRRSDADYSTVSDLQRRMENLLNEMDANADAYAKARQCQEFIGDRKKTVLGEAFQAVLATAPELSATAAEHRARASTLYKDRMKQLEQDHLIAETAIATYNLLTTRLEIARSLMAVEREKMARL